MRSDIVLVGKTVGGESEILGSGGLAAVGAGRAIAVERHFHALNAGAFWEGPLRRGFQRHARGRIKDGSALDAMKMHVFGQIGAIAGGAAIDLNLIDRSAASEGLEAVVHGSQRGARRLGLNAHEDLAGGGVIAAPNQHVEDLAPLPGDSEVTGEAVFESGRQILA